jgi:transcriptional regulator with XRE-family HTH domain
MRFVSDSKQAKDSKQARNSKQAGDTNPGEAAGEKSVDLGGFIKWHRQGANLSLRRLAERAGISNPYLSQIERGVRKPSAEILKRLSRALSISAETLYTRAGLIEEGPHPPPVVDAIQADTVLSPRQKQVMLDLYRTLVSVTGLPDGTTQERQEL